LVRLNLGSGQRRFDVTKGWINCDINYKREGQRPEVACSGENLPFNSSTVHIVVLHHVLEHFGCGEGSGLIKGCYEVLAPSGSLLVFVPDLKALAQGWLAGRVTEQIYKTNIYGAYQGEEEDRHKWGFTAASLLSEVSAAASWRQVKMFDWRMIDGADIAGPDWWILGIEAVK